MTSSGGDLPPLPPEVADMLRPENLLHGRCGRRIDEHPYGLPEVACPFPPLPERAFRVIPTRPVVTVCGLPEDPSPDLLRALAALGAAAAEAFGEPVTVEYDTAADPTAPRRLPHEENP